MGKKSSGMLAFVITLAVIVAFAFSGDAKANKSMSCEPVAGVKGANALYAQLSALDKNSRKDFYRSKTPEQQKALWLVHLHGYSLDHRLSAEQERLLSELTTTVKNGDFSKEGRTPLIAWFQTYQAQFLAAFGKAEMIELLDNLGGPGPFAVQK